MPGEHWNWRDVLHNYEDKDLLCVTQSECQGFEYNWWVPGEALEELHSGSHGLLLAHIEYRPRMDIDLNSILSWHARKAIQRVEWLFPWFGKIR